MAQAPARVVAPTSALADRLARLEAELDGIDVSSYAGQSPAEARATAARLRRIQSRLAAHVGAAVRAVEALVETRSAPQLLARDFGNDPRAASRELRQAGLVSESGLAERAAASGSISHLHAAVIGRSLRDMPSQTTQDQRAFAERALLRDAQRLSPKDLEIRGRRITDQFKTEAEVDVDEDALLRRREAMARANTMLSMWDRRDGLWEGRFRLPELHGRILKTMIDAYAAPRRSHLDQTADPFETLDHKQGRAFCQILEHIPVDRLPTSGGTPVQIVVTIDESKLRSEVAAATLTTGERISAGELRRLAVMQGILPAVLGGESIPVDLGRSQRLFSKAQREALAVMDGGCVSPGCDRPPSWCEANHLDPWESGGHTNLDNAVLLCSGHHHQAHQEGWKFRRANGVAHVDRGRGWECNHRFRA